MSDGEFEQASSGASETYPKQCSALRKGEYVMLKNHPCKISEMSTSKTGKHGHAKVKIRSIVLCLKVLHLFYFDILELYNNNNKLVSPSA